MTEKSWWLGATAAAAAADNGKLSGNKQKRKDPTRRSQETSKETITTTEGETGAVSGCYSVRIQRAYKADSGCMPAQQMNRSVRSIRSQHNRRRQLKSRVRILEYFIFSYIILLFKPNLSSRKDSCL